MFADLCWKFRGHELVITKVQSVVCDTYLMLSYVLDLVQLISTFPSLTRRSPDQPPLLSPPLVVFTFLWLKCP